MKRWSFYGVSILSSILFMILAVILMFTPAQILTGWGVELTSSAGVLARRISALYVGIAVMLFMARNTEHSRTSTALIRGVVTSYTLLALLGVYELDAGHVNSGILTGVFIEIVVALAFLYVGRTQEVHASRKPGQKS